MLRFVTNLEKRNLRKWS